MRYKMCVLVACFGFVLAGCKSVGPSIHPALGANVPLDKSDNFNASISESNRKQVVVVASENAEFSTQNRKLADSVFSRLNSFGISPLSKQTAALLGKEVLQLKQDASYVSEALKSVDYAIIVTVSAISYSSEFSPEETKLDKKGKEYTIDASCDYKFSARGRLEIVDVASRRLKQQVDFDESASLSKNKPKDIDCPVDESFLAIPLKDLYDEALQSNDAMKQLTHFLSPSYYVVGAYEIEKKVYYKTTVGLGKGVKNGRSVNLFSQNSDGSLLYFGKGKFINEKYADQQHSYIQVDKKYQPFMKRGTVLKVDSDPCEALDFKCQLKGKLF